MSVSRMLGDARRLCRLGGPPVDLVLTDPPYSTLERHRAVGSTTRLGDWFPVLSFDEILDVFAGLAETRLKPSGFIIATADFATALELAMRDGVSFDGLKGTAAPRGEVTGMRWRTPWVWRKTTQGGEPHWGMGYYGRQSYEMILVLQGRKAPAEEVKRNLRRVVNWLDVEDAPAGATVDAPVPKGRELYSTQKPEELGLNLGSIFCPRYGRILDPFAGAGEWVEAAGAAVEGTVELWDCNPAAPAVRR